MTELYRAREALTIAHAGCQKGRFSPDGDERGVLAAYELGFQELDS